MQEISAAQNRPADSSKALYGGKGTRRITVRDIVAKHAGPEAVRAAMVSERGYDENLWQLLCEQVGVAALLVPEEFGGAGIDVFATEPTTASPLFGLDNVVVTPHLGASTKEAERNCAIMAADSLRGFLEDGQVHNSVNFPEAVMARQEGTHRLVIVNRNVPNMVGQVSTLVAGHGQNIANLLNKSRGELAVTLVDVDGGISPEVLDELRAIDGVLSARGI